MVDVVYAGSAATGAMIFLQGSARTGYHSRRCASFGGAAFPATRGDCQLGCASADEVSMTIRFCHLAALTLAVCVTSVCA